MADDPPNWYPSKAETHRHVPTWNYTAVHVTGRIGFRHDAAAKRAAVGLLTVAHERALNGPRAWRMADAPADWMEVMIDAIVALRIDPVQVLAKAKLSQNREARDLAGAIDGARASGNQALADAMIRERDGR